MTFNYYVIHLSISDQLIPIKHATRATSTSPHDFWFHVWFSVWKYLTLKVADYYRPQRSWGKVIFSEACVKNSVHRGGCLGPDPGGKLGGLAGRGCLGPDPGGVQAHTRGISRPTPGGGVVSRPTPRGVSMPRPGGGGWCIPACTEADTPSYCCGWYASYWNAILSMMFVTFLIKFFSEGTQWHKICTQDLPQNYPSDFPKYFN